jgi:CDP-glucose 4,6-dehydratase
VIDRTRSPQDAVELSSAFGSVYAGRKVFVTGHTGFKGSWLCEWLVLLGAKVFGYSIDCKKPSLFSQLRLQQRIRDMRGDVRDLQALRKAVSSVKPEFVFHLAAQSLVRHSYADPVGTFTTNVVGSVNVMEVVRTSLNRCAVIMVTTDKCYKNPEGVVACSENDQLGGHDPYSASKAAAELAIDAYRKSFCGTDQNRRRIAIASARTGNVIGGGDFATDRILPDCVRALQRCEPIRVRNQNSTRPWQHVLEPLSGYLLLGQKLWNEISTKKLDPAGLRVLASAFNFGPVLGSARTVRELVAEVLRHWPGKWFPQVDATAPHEARHLNLSIDKASRLLGWRPAWDFHKAVAETVAWYRAAETERRTDLISLTRKQIMDYTRDAAIRGRCAISK